MTKSRAPVPLQSDSDDSEEDRDSSDEKDDYVLSAAELNGRFSDVVKLLERAHHNICSCARGHNEVPWHTRSSLRGVERWGEQERAIRGLCQASLGTQVQQCASAPARAARKSDCATPPAFCLPAAASTEDRCIR